MSNFSCCRTWPQPSAREPRVWCEELGRWVYLTAEAERLLQKYGINACYVPSTGEDGMILGRDVKSFHEAHPNWKPYYYVEFDGDSSYIDCGSDASLDNLHAASFTVDSWLLITGIAAYELVSKRTYAGAGWGVWTDPATFELNARVNYAPTAGQTLTIQTLATDTWTHVAMCFNVVDKKSYFGIDGVWCTYTAQIAAAGAIVSDAAVPFRMGVVQVPFYHLHGGVQWLRISSGLRWTPGVNFVPPAMCAPPAVDVTTIELWALDEGAGALAKAVVSSANNGTITDGTWGVCS